jgi:hypothetical protein
MLRITGKRTVVLLIVLTLTLVFALLLAVTASAEGRGPIIHHVQAGGPDSCASAGWQPGCDANWSLVAIEYADGSVSGQLIDRFWGGWGFHATIDCLYVDGNEAWVSGVITSGFFGGVDRIGEPVSARVRDNGTSANDPADQFSFSHVGADGGNHPHGTCDQHIDYDLYDAPQGQVQVR